MAGVPCNPRPVDSVATMAASLVAEGEMTKDILSHYPDLEAEDIREALLFAARRIQRWPK